MSSPTEKHYQEMANWLLANQVGTETVSEMDNLLLVLRENSNMQAWEAAMAEPLAAEVIAEAAAPKVVRPRVPSINWPRRLENFKRQQAEACRIEEEEEAARAAEAESALVRQRAAEMAAVRQAELAGMKAARKAGTGAAWGATRGPSMADKLKSTWAAAPVVAPILEC
jgi:hypothetical protein